MTYRAVRFDDLFAAESAFNVFPARAREDAMPEFFVVLGGAPAGDKRPTNVCWDKYSGSFTEFIHFHTFYTLVALSVISPVCCDFTTHRGCAVEYDSTCNG